jgi:hypothetical protein
MHAFAGFPYGQQRGLTSIESKTLFPFDGRPRESPVVGKIQVGKIQVLEAGDVNRQAMDPLAPVLTRPSTNAV